MSDGSDPGERIPISAPDAPAAVGPYSQAILHRGVLHCSGSIPIDPASGELIEGSVADEAERCLQNLELVCHAAGTTMAKAIIVTVYTTELGEFAAINERYAEFFAGGTPPARAALGVAQLPKGARVEITAQVAV